MSFFNKILKTMGFEGEEKNNESKNLNTKQKKEEKYVGVNASYDLKKQPQKQEEVVLMPKNQIEVQKLVGQLTKTDVIADLNELSATDFVRSLDFISGAVYITGGKIQKLEDKKFLFALGNDFKK